MSGTPTYLQTVNASSSPEVQMNENMISLEWASVYGKNPATTSGLTWGYWGGRWAGFAVASGTLSLTGGSASPNTINYVVVNRATGAISVSTSAANWNDTVTYARVYKIATAVSTVDAVEDHRAGPGGIHAGELSIPSAVESNSGSPQEYTLVLTDAENIVKMNYSTGNTLRIPANATVGFSTNQRILIYQKGAGQTSISVAGGVTLNYNATFNARLAGQHSMATLWQEATDVWVLTGDLEIA